MPSASHATFTATAPAMNDNDDSDDDDDNGGSYMGWCEGEAVDGEIDERALQGSAKCTRFPCSSSHCSKADHEQAIPTAVQSLGD